MYFYRHTSVRVNRTTVKHANISVQSVESEHGRDTDPQDGSPPRAPTGLQKGIAVRHTAKPEWWPTSPSCPKEESGADGEVIDDQVVNTHRKQKHRVGGGWVCTNSCALCTSTGKHSGCRFIPLYPGAGTATGITCYAAPENSCGFSEKNTISETSVGSIPRLKLCGLCKKVIPYLKLLL